MRPAEYSNTFIAMQDVSYRVIEDGAEKAIPKVGLLPVGSKVWLPDHEQQLGEARVVAFTDGIGKIAVSRNSLARRR